MTTYKKGDRVVATVPIRGSEATIQPGEAGTVTDPAGSDLWDDTLFVRFDRAPVPFTETGSGLTPEGNAWTVYPNEIKKEKGA